MMIDIASTLSYEEFDEVKDCTTSFAMWNKLKDIYGGDDNVRRAKVESLRGQFDHMRMREDENISNYSERIKKSVSTTIVVGWTIDDVIVVNKVLRTLLPIYAIRVLAIQEMRSNLDNEITLEALVGRLNSLELVW